MRGCSLLPIRVFSPARGPRLPQRYGQGLQAAGRAPSWLRLSRGGGGSLEPPGPAPLRPESVQGGSPVLPPPVLRCRGPGPPPLSSPFTELAPSHGHPPKVTTVSPEQSMAPDHLGQMQALGPGCKAPVSPPCSPLSPFSHLSLHAPLTLCWSLNSGA